ncbi:hypothetical protein [Streptomyces monashensis]|uniref:Uncharacterized protein n=1 Tax=Streptomyces monashensis TaxID=1678012 RepID=A0A1S2QG20_9ACTN|nr:hypothetical protein [Streptomyces monashensis]OIK04633.1 hypothetical protein BIV23_16420 [Streptomyces monashensis]
MPRRPPPAALGYRQALTALLAADLPGVRELRAQVAEVSLGRPWGAESPSTDLTVPSWVPAAPVADGVLPAVGTVRGDFGEPAGELLVWVSDGRLSALEYAWYGDTAPTRLPDPARIRVL